MQSFIDAMHPDLILLDVVADDLADVLRNVAAHLSEAGRIPESEERSVCAALVQREREISTAIGHGTAVPHAYLPQVREPSVVFVRLARPLDLGAPDGVPTRYFLVLLGPLQHAKRHLDWLSAVAGMVSRDEFHAEVSHAATPRELLDCLRRLLREEVDDVPSVASSEDDGLNYSGRFLGGLAADIRRRLAVYKDDFASGLHPKCLSSTLFLFFACLAPAVTFGGIMGDQTGGQIGAVEMLLASAVCGLIYAFVGGQPLIILGGIGPLLVFTGILYNICEPDQFLSVYACAGLWTSLFLIIMAVTESSCLMRYFTRFTDEIFAGLMSLIFIYEAVRALYRIFHKSFGTELLEHSTALMSLLLALGTYQIAISLSGFRRSRYLTSRVREFLADFGPAIALTAMAVLAAFVSSDIHLQTLQAPSEIRPTYTVPDTGEPRAWLVDLSAAPVHLRWLSAIPAALCAVLIYLAQNITGRLVNSPENRLQRGSAFHLDLAVVGLLIAACSLFGLPWLVAATVRSLAHVRALADFREKTDRAGNVRDVIVRVRENRMTGVLIHLLLGASLLFLPLLRQMPMAVLYGLFLYMGVTSIRGNQLFERLGLMFTDRDLYPQTHYVRLAPNRVIHSYTGIQLAGLAVLWGISLAPSPWVQLSFPLLILLLVPVRLLLNRMFSEEYLGVLDTREQPEDEESDWAV